MANHIIQERYTPLTADDKVAMGTIVNVILDEKETHYIQVSPDKDEPEWITVADFMEEVFGNLLEHKAFVDESLRIYHNKKNNPLFNIIKIMSEVSKIS